MDFVTKVLAILFGYVTLFYEVRGFHNDPKCGQIPYRRPKIIGGENVREFEFPWFVDIKETGRYECGGFIISQKTVLTAAHCFKHFAERVADAPKTISVTLAGHHRSHKRTKYSSKLSSKWELEVKVKKIIRHPQYNSSSNSGMFDIALLSLEDRIQWNHGTRPVCLPTTNKNYINASSIPTTEQIPVSLDFQHGEVAIVVGWPSARGETGGTDNILQKIHLKLYSTEECTKVLKDKNVTTWTSIDSSIICAASIDLGVDSCSGDSGSALLVQRGKVWVAIGIVSSGLGVCGNGVPGLYTRISSYIEWIDLHNDLINSSGFFQNFETFVPEKSLK